jgi:hypothetical protein
MIPAVVPVETAGDGSWSEPVFNHNDRRTFSLGSWLRRIDSP